LILPASTTRFHLATSAAMRCANASGVPVAGTVPSF
jgi:hypothetical protein